MDYLRNICRSGSGLFSLTRNIASSVRCSGRLVQLSLTQGSGLLSLIQKITTCTLVFEIWHRTLRRYYRSIWNKPFYLLDTIFCSLLYDVIFSIIVVFMHTFVLMTTVTVLLCKFFLCWHYIFYLICCKHSQLTTLDFFFLLFLLVRINMLYKSSELRILPYADASFNPWQTYRCLHGMVSMTNCIINLNLSHLQTLFQNLLTLLNSICMLVTYANYLDKLGNNKRNYRFSSRST